MWTYGGSTIEPWCRKKASDQVNWDFLNEVLKKFGFHQTLIKTIQALYNSPRARIKINGAISNSFALKRRTRQGCLRSPLLFAIFIEALSQRITQDNNIIGIKMLGQEHKMSLFTDDILIYLSNPKNLILRLLSFLDIFSSVLCYKLTIPKIQILSFNYRHRQSIGANIELD